MDGLGFGAVVLAQRKRLGWTQEELAARVGVSKGAVSKWENGQSYPDLPLLPRLAALFRISVDQLLDYRPQLSREEIRRLHKELSRAFVEQPFPQVRARCQELTAQYASCAPLLLRVGSLFLNYLNLAEHPQQLLEEAMELFSRARQSSQDANLSSEALHLEAYCLLCLKRPQEALSLLGEDWRPASPSETIQAMAYSQLGRPEKARQVLQAGIYHGLVLLFSDLGNYLELCLDADFPLVCRRAGELIQAFAVDRLHPGLVFPIYLAIARSWMKRGQKDAALEALEAYTALATGPVFPMRLHGDAFFNQLEEWLDQALELGDYPPRDESVIKKSLVQGVTETPEFAPLKEEPRYQALVRRLREHLEEHEIWKLYL